MPDAELDRRPRLLLAAAWSLALSERHDGGGAAGRAHPGPARRRRCAALRVRADPERRRGLRRRPRPLRRAARPLGGSDPPLSDPLLLQVHANRSAFRTLLDGEPALARLRQQQAPRGDRGAAPGYLGRWGDFIIGLQLPVGRPGAAGRAAAAADAAPAPRPTSAGAARSPACWRRCSPRRSGSATSRAMRQRCWPTGSTCLSAAACPRRCCSPFARMARIAAPRAPSTGRSSCSARWTPSARRAACRGCASPAWREQVRLHARRYRAETCRELCARIDALLADRAPPRGRLWRATSSCCASWRAATRRSRRRTGAARRSRWRAPMPLAQAVKQSAGCTSSCSGLRAWALDRCGEKSLRPLRGGGGPGAGLRPAAGLRRRPSRPSATGCARRCAGGTGPAPPTRCAAARRRRRAATPRRDRAPSMALTPKEREVLELLARNLSNKEIGLAMQVGEETDQVAREEPFRQARRGHAQAGGFAGADPGAWKPSRLSAATRQPAPSTSGGTSGAPPL